MLALYGICKYINHAAAFVGYVVCIMQVIAFFGGVNPSDVLLGGVAVVVASAQALGICCGNMITSAIFANIRSERGADEHEAAKQASFQAANTPLPDPPEPPAMPPRPHNPFSMDRT